MMSPSSRKIIFLLSILFGVVSPFAQSLQEKIALSKKQESKGIYTTQIDSLTQLQEAQNPSKAVVADSAQSINALDSLLLGPVDSLLDSTLEADTLPKRYSQQIFSSSPGTLFGSYPSAIGRSYVLGAGDQLKVSIWGDVEAQYSVQLDNSGKINLKGVGRLSLNGLSMEYAEKKVRNALSRIYSGINKARATTFVEISNGSSGPIKIFVLGEVETPGGFIFSGNTSILSALYQAKGPTDIGSVRSLQLTRGGKTHTLDLYDYLLKGKQLTPNSLHDGDILFSKRASVLVEIQGDVGRPAIYELKKGEGVKELLQFSGGLNPTAAHHRVSLKRLTETGDKYEDLSSPQDYLSGKAQFKLMDGDVLVIDSSSETSDHFISVTGPVKYEGRYDSRQIKNIADLVKMAGGLKKEAFLGRVHVLRFNDNGSSQLFSYSLENTEITSIELQGKDNVILYNKKDMYSPDSIEIAGAVFRPGFYPYSRGMTIKDFVLRAGGFLPQYEEGKALVFRINNLGRVVKSTEVTLSHGLENTSSEYKLEPRDLIHIPVNPNWYDKEVVTLSGEFKYPGKYALLFPGEKLDALIKRAGGLKKDAYQPGFKFYRTKDLIGRIGIDLDKAVTEPEGRMNIAMKHGDSLYVPEWQNSIKVMGEVGFATSVLYKKGAGVKYYIARAGGFTRFSDKKHVVLEYANGETTNEFYRAPDPGSVVYVPSKPEDIPKDWLRFTADILSILAAAVALVFMVTTTK